jgi:hypothetical protein
MRQRKTGIAHGKDRRVDSLVLHRHEIHERVVEIEDNGFDHGLRESW